MNTAIVTPNESIYSETFIRAGIELLPGKKCVFTGGALPGLGPHGKRLFPPCGAFDRAWFLMRRTLKSLSTRQMHVERVARELKHNGTHVVLAHYATTGVEMLEPCRKASLPLVVHCHGFDAHMHSVVETLREKMPSLGKFASSVIAVSVKMQDALVDLGVPTEKIVLARYGVDCRTFQAAKPAENPPLFLAVGRFTEKKAPYLTLLAFQQVLSEVPNARLVMIGKGNLLNICRNLTHSLGMDQSVTFPGALSHDQVAKYMQSARAFVQHSIEPKYGDHAGDCEGTPLAVLEASASGLPVVSTRHAGISEAIIEGCTGLLVDELDVDGMAIRMIQLAREPRIAQKLGTAGRKHIEAKYNMTQYIKTLNETLKSAVKGGES